MDNLDSSPQLLIPLIPDSDCPKGTLVEVMNYFFQTYLAQATINVPGIGDVTPQEITTLKDRLTEIENKIAALNFNVRSETIAFNGTGNLTINVAFTTALPDNNYSINIELNSTDSITSASGLWYVVDGTKSDTGFTIRFIGITSSTTSFTYTARQIV